MGIFSSLFILLTAVNVLIVPRGYYHPSKMSVQTSRTIFVNDNHVAGKRLCLRPANTNRPIVYSPGDNGGTWWNYIVSRTRFIDQSSRQSYQQTSSSETGGTGEGRFLPYEASLIVRTVL